MDRIAITSEEELTGAVRDAREQNHTLEICGRGTKRGYGRPVTADCMLDLSALTGILSYEPEELVLTARPGTPLAEIEAAIGENHQRLGFDPADWGPLFGTEVGAGTIGGVLAADTSGSARVRYGAARDHLLGFRAVNGFGESYKAGGRVVKNVTGFDLPKLMCGAMGTLGPLSEVTLRLVPRGVRALTLAVKDIPPERGLALIRRVWASPLEATGLAYIPACIADAFPMLNGIGTGVALIRIEGAAEPLAEKRDALRTMPGGEDSAIIENGDAVFARIGAGGAFAGSMSDVWRLHVPPSEATATAHALAGTRWYADWAGGLIWAGMSETNEASAAKLRQIASRAHGYAVLLRANAEVRGRVPVFPPREKEHVSLTRAVKGAFDPLGLFNPGRMIEGV